VIWVQHSGDDLVAGSEGWEYVPELTRRDGEPLVAKRYGDAFEATDLERLLAGRGVGRLIVAGAETDACIRSTIHGAFTRGYDVTLVSDAHTAQDKTAWGAPPVPLVDRTHESFLEPPTSPRTHGTRHQDLGGDVPRLNFRRTARARAALRRCRRAR
jgi:hypothetical protein